MTLKDLQNFNPEDDIEINYDEDDVLLDGSIPRKRAKIRKNCEGCHKAKDEELEINSREENCAKRPKIKTRESVKRSATPVARKSRTIKEDIYDREEGFSTTFRQDFSIADRFGINAIKDTYNRAFKYWKDDYRYLTDLVITLNHKIWEWYEKDEEIARVYNDLWEKADNYACTHLKGDELSYFYRVTD